MANITKKVRQEDDLSRKMWIMFFKNEIENGMKDDLIKNLDEISNNVEKIRTIISDIHVNPTTMKFDAWRMANLRKRLGDLNYDSANLSRIMELSTMSVEEQLKDECNNNPNENFSGRWQGYGLLVSKYKELLLKPKEELTEEERKKFEEIEKCLKENLDDFEPMKRRTLGLPTMDPEYDRRMEFLEHLREIGSREP